MLSSASSSFLVDEGHQSQNSAFSRLVVLFTFFLLTTWNVHLEFSHLASGFVHTTSFLKERENILVARVLGLSLDRATFKF